MLTALYIYILLANTTLQRSTVFVMMKFIRDITVPTVCLKNEVLLNGDIIMVDHEGILKV